MCYADESWSNYSYWWRRLRPNGRRQGSPKRLGVILLEKMSQTGRKIGISGKGRRNLTNYAGLDDFLGRFGKNGRFLRQCFQQFFSNELIAFFASQNLPLVTEIGGRAFPESGRALDVVKVLNNWLQTEGVKVIKTAPASSILTEKGG